MVIPHFFDGNDIVYSPTDIELALEEVGDIDAELEAGVSDSMRRELIRQKRQIIKEIAAGRRLPLEDEDEPD